MNNNTLIAKLKEYIIPKIPRKKSNKGRHYSVSNDKLIEAIFYVLKYGITWELASKLVMGDVKYKCTLNRRYIELIKFGIITDIHNQLVQEYINENKIDDIYIDSMDTINGNCNKNNTAKSFKLHSINKVCRKNDNNM
jgi:transposase